MSMPELPITKDCNKVVYAIVFLELYRSFFDKKFTHKRIVMHKNSLGFGISTIRSWKYKPFPMGRFKERTWFLIKYKKQADKTENSYNRRKAGICTLPREWVWFTRTIVRTGMLEKPKWQA